MRRTECSSSIPQFVLINPTRLSTRLINELTFVVLQTKREWSSFRRNPKDYSRLQIENGILTAKRWMKDKDAVTGALTSLSLLITLVVSAYLLDIQPRTKSDEARSELMMLRLPKLGSTNTQSLNESRVGLNNGHGEGSSAEPRRARGGGGSGNQSIAEAQRGAIPPPSNIPAPLNPVRKNPALPAAGIKLDPVLWKALPFSQYGDPRSASQTVSNGPGRGGVMGDGNGSGVGEGNGPGFGSGTDGNTGGGSNRDGGGGQGCLVALCSGNDRVFQIRQVEQRARILSKPEPQYTEEARRNQISGTVTLRVVFSSRGEVTNIRTIEALPFGLTEQAITAARKIRFVPAMLNGHSVSVHMQLEYNFNLY